MIVPVLKQLLGKNPNLELLIVGILELPVELKLFASQIQMEGFVDYQKLPERIASVDINLAPLTDTIFNRAKSENKWVEAALVQTVTAASNLGAFAEMVQDGEDGVLCRDEAEWLEKLQWLIDDEPARKAIAGRHMAGAAASVSQSFMPPGFASGWSATGIYAVPLCFQRWRSAEASALHFFMRKCW